jgi:hypothetical protein
MLTSFFSFDVQRSMFDVRRSSLKTTHGINATRFSPRTQAGAWEQEE